MYFCRVPDGQITLASGRALATGVDRQQGETKKRGRKLLLEAYQPWIEAYLDSSDAPTIKELDDILFKAGARYSSTASIKNMLQSLGRNIPWNVTVEASASAGR